MGPWQKLTAKSDIYQDYLNDLYANTAPAALKFSALVVCILNLSFIGIDVIFFPEHLVTLTIVRISMMLAMMVLYFGFSKYLPRYGTLYGVMATSAHLFVIIAIAGRLDSFYTSSTLLILAGTPILLPVTGRESIFLTAFVIGGLWIISLFTPQSESIPFILMHTTFPMCGGVVSIAGSYIIDRFRFDQFSQRHNLKLVESSLKESNEKLQVLDRAKSQFFSNVSHELRTPLTMILGPLEDMMKNPHQPPKAEYLLAMKNNSIRLLRQVNSILDFSKIESGHMQLNLVNANIQEILERVVQSAKPYAFKHGIDLNLESTLMTSSAVDRTHIETVITNLVSNAIKFTPKGGKIYVKAAEDKEKITVAVKDTGVGISEDQLQNLFKRFFQGDSSITRKWEGTGLGLALSRELVRLHGGDITVKSKKGKGTTFEVWIPIRHDVKSVENSLQESSSNNISHSFAELDMTNNSDSDQVYLNSSSEGSLIRKEDRRPHLLYADDNSDLRFFVRSLLESEYKISLAVDGKAAWDFIQKNPPDLILSDVMMPNMSGYDLLNEVKSNPKTKDIPVVLLTAKNDLDSRVEGLTIGADDYLGKPFSEREMKARLKNLLALRETQRRLRDEIRAASNIQKTLLPKYPYNYRGLGVDIVYRPCDDLSGDFFDIVETEKWLYICVADVSSHGTASAQVTYLVREQFRFHTQGADQRSLSELVDMMAKSYSEFDLPFDVVLQVIRIDPQSGRYQYCRAGANEGIEVIPGQTSRFIESDPNPILSKKYDPKIKFNTGSGHLNSSGCIYLFTDGCYERRENHRAERQFIGILEKSPLNASLDEVFDKFQTDLGLRAEDDATLVRVSWQGRIAKAG